MAKTEEVKQLAINARASKLWRTLRIASKNKFGLFDKIDDGNNLEALFEVPQEGKNAEKASDDEIAEPSQPDVAESPKININKAPEPIPTEGETAV